MTRRLRRIHRILALAAALLLPIAFALAVWRR
jgi:hypothetical protein